MPSLRAVVACCVFSAPVLAATTFCPAQSFTYFSGIVAPEAMPIQASDGNIYAIGTPGDNSDGSELYGTTLYRLTPDGTATPIYTGNYIYSVLQATDGNLYGVDGNTIFRVTLAGVSTPLYTFSGLIPNSPDPHLV